jgi:hypothetical protein
LDLQEILDLRDNLDHEDLRVHQVPLEAEDHPVQQDLLAHRVPLALLVNLVQPEELVQLVNLDQVGQQVHLALQVHQDRLV